MELSQHDPKRAHPRDQAKDFDRISRARNRLDKTMKAQNDARAVMDSVVAEMVSSEPLREDWYAHPGPLTRDQVMGAGNLTTVSLHRLMERHRKRNAAPKNGKKRVAR